MNQNYRYGEIPRVNAGKQQVTLIFNALNGSFISATTAPYSLVDTDDPLCIYIVDEMSMDLDEVVGGLKVTYNSEGELSYTPDYKISPIGDGPTRIYESTQNELVAQNITKKYSVVEQLNIIARAVKKISSEAGIEVEELEEYIDFVETVKETNRRHVEHFKANEGYRYVTIDEENERMRLTFEGGLHERLGARPITGGVVF